mmetsp:Transcript_21400/g.65113  ORF Transcript_21400/g.65113 Transcript_21400/m.65113 type:complete len:286 (-) Transcript_21400:44-901(-)
MVRAHPHRKQRVVSRVNQSRATYNACLVPATHLTITPHNQSEVALRHCMELAPLEARGGVAGELSSLLVEVAAEDEVLKADILLRPRLAAHGLLRHEAGRRKHGEAAMRELALLHGAEFRRVLGLEAKRVETEVARVVVIPKALHVVHALVRVGPALLDAEGLGEANTEGHQEPHGRRKTRNLLDGGATVAREEWVEVLLNKEASGSKHANTAMSELSLAPAVHLLLAGSVEEIGRVEVASWSDVARESVAEVRVGGGDGLHRGHARGRLERGNSRVEREHRDAS